MSRGTPSESRASSVVILGADAVLAALPATPVQLAHACQSLGYDMAFPSSWGDELIAERCLEQLAARESEPAILCACPYTIERLTRAGNELAPWMITSVSPPVATARYLRALYGERPVHITYVGACPASGDPSIDTRATADELLAAFAERGIVPADQPELFESVLPPDRRRFYSIPGGAPSTERLAALEIARSLVEVEGDDLILDLAQYLLSRHPSLIDLAPRLGCACAGVLAASDSSSARPVLVSLEPPRARAAILDADVTVDLKLLPGEGLPVTFADAMHVSHEPRDPSGSTGPDATAFRSGSNSRPPTPVLRRASSATPAVRRDDGCVVPRAYARHRHLANRSQLAELHPAAVVRKGSGRPGERGLEGREGRGRERTGRQGEARKPRRALGPVVLSMPNDPPRPAPPPPPAPHRPDVLFG
jgi:hypothetical protein